MVQVEPILSGGESMVYLLFFRFGWILYIVIVNQNVKSMIRRGDGERFRQ